MVNSREMYMRYTLIRDCVNDKKCKRLSMTEVKRRAAERVAFIHALTGLTEEEIFFTITYCEKNFPALK